MKFLENGNQVHSMCEMKTKKLLIPVTDLEKFLCVSELSSALEFHY